MHLPVYAYHNCTPREKYDLLRHTMHACMFGNFICSLDKKRYSTRNEDRIPNITTANIMSSYLNTETKEVNTKHRIWRL